MKTIEKTNAKIVLDYEEMSTLCDAFRILRNIDSAMNDNKARYVDTGFYAHNQDEVQAAIEILDHITGAAYRIAVDGFPLEIANDF